MSEKDENADLRKRVEELEAKVAPPPVPPMSSDAAWRDEMRAMSERRMNFASPPLSAEERKAMNDACGPSAIRDIVGHGAMPGPSGQIPTTAQIGAVHGPSGIAGSGTGWVTPPPLGPPPGVAQADRLMDEADRRDKAELAQRLARAK
jgi:hypothetical protein